MSVPESPTTPVLHEDWIDYTPCLGSVRVARHRVARLADAWGLPALAGDVALLTGELAGNALLHGSTPERMFRVRLRHWPCLVRVEVTDPRSERMPTVKAPTDEDQFGRGLLIVDHVASRWGVSPLIVGKTVWAEIAFD